MRSSSRILFPAVMAAGNATFPAPHRGLAIVLVLAASDLGQLVGAPATGAILKTSRSAGLAPYPTMFLAMAGLMSLAGIWYSIASRPAGLSLPKIPSPSEGSDGSTSSSEGRP